MAIDDPQDFVGGLKRERERLVDSDAVHTADVEPIQEWLRKKDGSVKISSLKTYLRRIRIASERADMPIVEMGESDYQQLVFDLRHEHGLADSTVHSYEAALLMFIEDMTGAEWVADVERTSVEPSTVDPSELLTPEDVHRLVSTARTQRDVAFIEFLADTGARLSMALSLRVKDVDLTKPPTYKPNSEALGLKDAPIQEYPLIDSAASVRSYLRTSHPRPDEPDVALFHKTVPFSRGEDGERWTDDGSVRPNAARQQLVRIADRADIDKPVNPHMFRHVAITRMVREGYSRSQIEHRVHWTLDTDMWETYEHITGAEHTEDIFREAGLIDSDDAPDRIRKPCGNCAEPLAPHHDWCPNCGEPASPAASSAVTSQKDTILEQLVSETNPATRRELRALIDEIEDRPDTADVHDDPS